jgi:hypothetical protein
MLKGFAGEWRYVQGGSWGMNVWSNGSLGNEGMLKGFAGGMNVRSRGSLGEWRYVQGVCWGMTLSSKGSLGNEGMFKGFAGEWKYVQGVRSEWRYVQRDRCLKTFDNPWSTWYLILALAWESASTYRNLRITDVSPIVRIRIQFQSVQTNRTAPYLLFNSLSLIGPHHGRWFKSWP